MKGGRDSGVLQGWAGTIQQISICLGTCIATRKILLATLSKMLHERRKRKGGSRPRVENWRILHPSVSLYNVRIATAHHYYKETKGLGRDARFPRCLSGVFIKVWILKRVCGGDGRNFVKLIILRQ